MNIPENFAAEKYSLELWYEWFEAATAEDKPAVAALWLKSYDGPHPDGNEFGSMEPDLIADRYAPWMRKMVLSLPWRDPLFMRIKEREVFHTGNWLRGLLGDQHGFDAIGLIRDLWLQTDSGYRKQVLLYMAAERVKEMHPNYAILMRIMAWDLAKEHGMDSEVAAAATKVTLWSLHNSFSYDQTGGHDVLDALQLICSKHAPGERPAKDYCSDLSIHEAKNIIAKYPGVILIVLQYMEQQGLVDADIMLHGGRTQEMKFESLAHYLPGRSSEVRAMQAMGTNYEETLNALVLKGFVEQEVLPLPTLLNTECE